MYILIGLIVNRLSILSVPLLQSNEIIVGWFYHHILISFIELWLSCILYEEYLKKNMIFLPCIIHNKKMEKQEKKINNFFPQRLIIAADKLIFLEFVLYCMIILKCVSHIYFSVTLI